MSEPSRTRLSRASRRLSAAGAGSLWYLLLVVVLPTVSLMGIALYALWQSGQLLLVLLGWLGVTLIAYLIFVNLPHRKARRKLIAARKQQDQAVRDAADGDLPDQLDERADWSERDSAIWQRRCIAIEETLASDPAWDALPALAIDELAEVATEYHGPKANARYRFTLPEGLLVVSVASERYRRLVKDSVPFADRITVASLVTLYERQAQIVEGLTWLDRARRIARLVNPLAAAVGELRDQFTGRVLSETTSALQQDLKRLLLQEIAQVGIDLYSGRLKVSDDELARYQSRAVRDDSSRGVEAAEPLRVVLLGQVSAGKSSLVNALADTLAAEVDLLPTTDRTTVHVLHAAHPEETTGDGGAAPDDATLHVVDTPGIDDDPDRQRQLVRVASDADLIIWVARATQPARAPDQRLHAQLAAHFAARPERRMPPVLLALTHIDRLPPRNEWDPPYDLEWPAGKSATIRRALDSAAAAIGLDADTPEVPVSLDSPSGVYNVDTVAAQIMMLADEATLAQFNRRRVERGGDTGGWRARWRQTRALGVAVGKRVIRRTTER